MLELGAAMHDRVLVVDDYPDSADTLAALVAALGHETRVAYDGCAALKQFLQFSPDIAFIDLQMPRCDGYETAARIRSEAGGQNIILVAVTGWTRDEDRERAMQAGFDLFIIKPIDPTMLQSLLSEPGRRVSPTKVAV